MLIAKEEEKVFALKNLQSEKAGEKGVFFVNLELYSFFS